MDEISSIGPKTIQSPAPPAHDERLLKQAQEFEAVFVAQMLKYGGFADALSQNSGFGGEAFSSLLLEAYAENIVERGGFGIAEKIYQQLQNHQPGGGSDVAV